MPGHFLRGRRCPRCRYLSSTNQEAFAEKFERTKAGDYTLLSPYLGARVTVKIRHEACGCEWWCYPNNFLKGTRCPKCANNLRKTTTSYRQEVLELTQGEYEVLGEYVNAHYPIELRHNICGNTFFVAPSYFVTRKKNCPHCGKKNRRVQGS